MQTEKEQAEAELEKERALVNELAEQADTIPTYILLYQDQVKKWQKKEAEKDAEIARLHQVPDWRAPRAKRRPPHYFFLFSTLYLQVIAAYSDQASTPQPAAV